MRTLLVILLSQTVAALKVTVLGGTGFTGSRVCKQLVQAGCDVVSVSATGKAPSTEEWVKSVDFRANSLTRGPREGIAEAIGNPDAIVSCVGAIGFDVQGLLLGNGVANVEAAKVAKQAGVSRFVYVSVASELVTARDWLPAFFSGYFDGKENAEEAITAEFGECSTFIKPTFIYGGEDFGLFPPRVNSAYGSAVEEILSSKPFDALANALPGLIKVALRPPVSVDAVAGAAVAAALGKTDAMKIDGTAQINQAASQPPATGLSDFTAAISSKVSELTSEKA